MDDETQQATTLLTTWGRHAIQCRRSGEDTFYEKCDCGFDKALQCESRFYFAVDSLKRAAEHFQDEVNAGPGFDALRAALKQLAEVERGLCARCGKSHD